MEWMAASKEGLIIFSIIMILLLIALAIYKHTKSEQTTVKKKKVKTSAWVIPFVIFSLFSFTGIAVYVQIKTGIELSSTLITCFFAFCTGELWMLASIKKSKLRNGDSPVDNIINRFTNKNQDEIYDNENNNDGGGLG